MDTAVSVELFVEILNRYVYYFDQQNETVSTVFQIHTCGRLMFSGHDEVLERVDRAHSLESSDQPGKLIAREPKAAFPEDTRLHLV